MNGLAGTPRPPRAWAASRSGRAIRAGSRSRDRPAPTGCSPAASRRARMKASMAFRGQSASWTCGGGARPRRDESPVRLVFRSVGDPLLEHLLVCARRAGPWPRRAASARWRRRRRSGSTSSLSSGLPGTIGTAPEAAGFTASSRTSSRSFAFRALSSGPWHLKQCRARIGRTWLVKRSGAGALFLFSPDRENDGGAE